MKKLDLFCILASLIALGAFFFIVLGCTPEDAASLRKEVIDLRARSTTMPAGHAKDELIKQLDRAESRLGDVEQYIGFGLGVGGIALSWYYRLKKNAAQKNLENVVTSIDTVMPPRDEETKLKLAALQGPETTKVVNAIKNGGGSK